MKNYILNVCIHANQNTISKSETEKIRRKVKRFFPDHKIKMHPNVDKDFAEALDGNKITYGTSDINYVVSGFVIEYPEVTNVFCEPDIRNIKLN